MMLLEDALKMVDQLASKPEPKLLYSGMRITMPPGMTGNMLRYLAPAEKAEAYGAMTSVELAGGQVPRQTRELLDGIYGLTEANVVGSGSGPGDAYDYVARRGGYHYGKEVYFVEHYNHYSRESGDRTRLSVWAYNEVMGRDELQQLQKLSG
jgi:hypothetical protein